MTELVACAWCGRPVARTPGAGRPRRYCRRSCRQREYEARQRARAHGLDEHEIVITRAQLDELRDKVFVLRCAIDDVRRDLTGTPTRADYADAVAWLLDAAEPLVER